MRDAPHRLLIVSGLVGSVWIGFAASRFHFFDYQYECGLVDLCDYADVIRGREGHWLYFGVAALVLAVGVFLHVRRGRAVPPRPEPWSPLLLLVPGLAWALALPVAFLTMFWGDHLMAAGLLALLVGAADRRVPGTSRRHGVPPGGGQRRGDPRDLQVHGRP